MKEECDCLTKEAYFFLQVTPELGLEILALHCESSGLELRHCYHSRQVLNGQSSS